MKRFQKKFRKNGFFTFIFAINALGIIIVSIVVTLTTVKMSEDFFVDKYSINNVSTMNQIRENIENFNYSLILTTNTLLQSKRVESVLSEDETNREKLSSFYQLRKQLDEIKNNLPPYEMEITLLGKNELYFETNYVYWPINIQKLRNSNLVKNSLDNPDRLLYQNYKMEVPLDNYVDSDYVIISRPLIDKKIKEKYGMIFYSIYETEFRKLYSNFVSEGSDVFLMNNEGTIISSSKDNLIGTKSDELLMYADEYNGQEENYLIGNIMGKDQIILFEYLDELDMYICNVIDKKLAVGNLINKSQIVIICVSIVLVSLLVVYFVSRRLTKSLSILVKQISNTSKYNFDQHVEVNGMYETAQIALAYNSMLDELHEYLEKLVFYQKEKRNAELAALQQQINPHFLYNTLASIKFLVIQGEKDEAEESINSLISLLVNTIGNGSELINIEQEISNLKDYVLIQHKRYGNRIKVNYFISPDCKECIVPKLILQPFIENAFFHGFNVKDSGFINVMVWKEKELLICEIIDNGDGMAESNDTNSIKKSKKQQFTGIGIKNVHERIQIIYGNQFGVNITSELQKGTKVRIIFPATEEKKE